ncbi:hypothetical protein DMR_36670 [Solidesulfovibrio magneticus RS-1]|uniref:Uncharacterized protein n=1 Tax=Solidesulfovibrio magneticus (strain ATCC 700980 / DSM 13731 / RS-1) TaxID=573370 RepID=C4XM30_SOLM1|nr:hypothetical protein DMR_36670 [Solidesulfovibrio magneticus RS-1]
MVKIMTTVNAVEEGGSRVGQSSTPDPPHPVLRQTQLSKIKNDFSRDSGPRRKIERGLTLPLLIAHPALWIHTKIMKDTGGILKIVSSRESKKKKGLSFRITL